MRSLTALCCSLLFSAGLAGTSAADVDGDGAADEADNCLATPNGPALPDAGGQVQLDADGDSFGNVCDADFDGDFFVGGPDFDVFLACFGREVGAIPGPPDDPGCAESDMNGDGLVGGPDFDLFLQGFGGPPGPAGGATLEMEPDLAAGFMAFPWPNDIRVRADGSVDMADYPGTDNGLVQFVLNRGSRATTGFATSGAIYFQASTALDPASLPGPGETDPGTAGFLLLDLDDPQAPPHPLLFDFKQPATDFRPANLLSMLVYPGRPLREETRYAAVAFRDLRDATGRPLRPAPLLGDLADPWDGSQPLSEAGWDALRSQWDAVQGAVTARTPRFAEEIVAFSVFTTTDATGEMDAIAAAIAALPDPVPVDRSVGSCDSGGSTTTVTGQLDLPKWQAGVFPFGFEGGAIVVEDGVAVQQSVERVVLSVTFPCGEAPPAGWPILLYMNGTGGSAQSSGIGELGGGTDSYLVASIAPLYSGDRDPGGGGAIEFLFFNFLNPQAGRTNQIQQAADMIYLRRIAEGLSFTAEEAGSPVPVETDDELVVITGHSQGALTIPITLAVDPHFAAGFLSAGGAGLYHAIVHRGDIRVFVDDLLGLPLGELDAFHPIPQALQTIAEVGDAGNYGVRARDAHVLSIGGLLDGCSPWETISHVGTSLALEIVPTSLHPTFGSAAAEPAETAFPVSGNLDGRTAVTVQTNAGHFGAHANPVLARDFLDGLAAGGVPIVDPIGLDPDFNPGCAGRADPLPSGAGARVK